MEDTAPGTPQKNRIVERRFATNRHKTLAMMLAGQLKPEPDLAAGRNAHPEQEMITEHRAGRRITVLAINDNNSYSEDEEAGRMIVEEDNDDGNAMTEAD
jgi:hypothetical protein